MSEQGARTPRTWRVWARITGPQLPLADVRIGNAILGPGPAGYRPPAPPTAPTLNMVADATFFVATAPTMRVVSDCWVVVADVQAARSDEAIRKASAEEILPLVAALSAGETKNPYRVQTWGVDDGKQGSSLGDPAKTTAFHKEDLDPAKLAEVRARVTLLHTNTRLAVASEVFCRGVQYSDFVAGPPTAASAILAYYQVLEACAGVVPWVQPPDYDNKNAAIAAKLKAALESKTLSKKKAAAIRAASGELDRLDAKYVSLRIEHAAAIFGLEKRWIERSRELGKFRNNKLGHANSLPLPRELSEWEDDGKEGSAYALASIMLAAAFKYIQEGTARSLAAE